MPRHETQANPAHSRDRARAKRIFSKLNAEYPDARCDLLFDTPFQLLVATILSAQCLDATVNRATPALFERGPTPEAMSKLPIEEIETLVRTCGFYRNKAKNILATATLLNEAFGGVVPQTMEELLTLPGVARKTANVVLGNAFNINHGVTVDTHVGRLSVRLGLTGSDSKNAVAIERDLAGLFPRETWTHLSHLFIWHGRAVCTARSPRCNACLLKRTCPKIGVDGV